jgi:hypothetical protein
MGRVGMGRAMDRRRPPIAVGIMIAAGAAMMVQQVP